MLEWWNGIHVGLKNRWANVRVGSTPTSSTNCAGHPLESLSPEQTILKVSFVLFDKFQAYLGHLRIV